LLCYTSVSNPRQGSSVSFNHVLAGKLPNSC